MKWFELRILICGLVLFSVTGFTRAQNPVSPPPPQPQTNLQAPPPPPNNQIPGNTPAQIPGPPPGAPVPPGWGAPGFLNNIPPQNGMNQGNINVMATGYDSEGVLKQIPLFVSYNFNGVGYNVTVLNVWNPYTESWTIGVDAPAYATSYYLNGFTYNYYAPLALGTFYFNL